MPWLKKNLSYKSVRFFLEFFMQMVSIRKQYDFRMKMKKSFSGRFVGFIRMEIVFP